MRRITLRRVVLTTGFTCQLLLVTYTVWSTMAGMVPLVDAESFSVFSLRLRSLSFCSTFFLGAVIYYVFPQISGQRLVAGALCLLIIGIVCQAIGLMVPSVSFEVMASILMGAGTAAFFLLWEEVFAQENLRFVGFCLGVSMCISGGLYALLYRDVDPLWAVAILAAVMSGSMIYFHRTANRKQEANQKATHNIMKLRSFLLDIWPSLLCVVAIYLVSGITRTTAIRELSDYSFSNMASMASMLLSGILLVVFWHLFRDKINIAKVYQVIFPFVATGFLALPFLGEAFYAYFVGFTFLFVSLIASLIMITSIQFGQKSSLHPVFVYGFIGGACYLSSLLGDILGGRAHLLSGYGFVQVLAISFVCLYILSMVLLALHKGNATVSLKPADEPPDLFEESCAIVITQNGLSQREAETMKMIARGRDLPTISKTLCISKGTVQTHSKSLYRKLGIHSKQELIDLIEDIMYKR